ncbi:hypothetical protein [Caballeronia sp. INDeC2]|nr:hypothetical protein [Caballeronia sp. INDeC2]
MVAATGLTRRQSYREIFAITLTETLAVGFVIVVDYATGLSKTVQPR